MISVVIPTHDSERLLVPTLAALVPGALAGVVREVIVTDAGSTDETGKVADIAGCRFDTPPGPLGARLAAAANMTRAPWLMFLRPGSVPDANWLDAIARFVSECEAAGEERAAVFRPRPGRGRSMIAEALALAAVALGARAKPEQGLLVTKKFYAQIGGHNAASDDPETELLRRIGRARIAMLGCAMMQSR
jgi:glycosyltransferase involved in cell wall biosynthesis